MEMQENSESRARIRGQKPFTPAGQLPPEVQPSLDHIGNTCGSGLVTQSLLFRLIAFSYIAAFVGHE